MTRLLLQVPMVLLLALCCFAGSPAASLDDTSLWLGAQGGYTHLVPNARHLTSKNGYHLFLAAWAEWSDTQWSLALGGGFFYNRVYSDGERDFATDQPDIVREQTNLRIETRAGSAEFAVRRHLGLGLEAGLSVHHLFGASLSFSQDKDSQSGKFFIGPQLVLKMNGDAHWAQQMDLNLSADSNVPKLRVYLLSAGFALGRSLASNPAQPVKASPASVDADRYEEILADKLINFPSASAQLQEPALSFLRELAEFLRDYTDLWQHMEVEGHTDKKGKLSYNLKLSQDRADAVRQVFLDRSVDPGKISARGFGPNRPLVEGDSPEALATNRRVVMVFQVHQREARNQVASEIKSLRKKYFNE